MPKTKMYAVVHVAPFLFGSGIKCRHNIPAHAELPV